MKILSFFSLFVILMGSLHAATLTTYVHDITGFLLATGATQATDAYSGPNNVSSYSAPGAFGNIVFTTLASGLYFGSEWTGTLPGNEIAISGLESMKLDLPVYAYALGFHFYDNVGDQSTFTLTLFNNTTNIGSFTFNTPDNVASFVGVSSDVAFNKVQIVETIGDSTNDYYGLFYLSTTAIPEPSTIVFFMVSFVAMLFFKINQ
ncbi:MAG: hypothetical protein HUU50_21995 [Candidatus Brocadiae bacterium]|nr:hypothetical protein [Candidatus Brocadiia bacterium]